MSKPTIKKQLGGKISETAKNNFKINCAKLGITMDYALDTIVKNFNKNGLPE